ncbi:ubiquinol-cytochrome C reductase [Sulfurifustis variabilis]|uniref:Ubiquinol-cytochrome c reductase iron-sulfur subunit n=1 Tax=Sulfurifustis variabilis TaxID=1675686 RepID=A0A1B4V1G8_9GAMM|nr:ubiquinol-cytochrome c reductase iron-sulfur subunit [Sulfurifustis variabilis]BAU47253.1 ubiquinol-cytochrome C reductase [Sulfurifustis variabilis]
MSDEGVDPRRRRLLAITTGLGLIGTAFTATPFILSMTPSARAKAAGAPVEVDISRIEPGQLITVEWRGKPVWILKRTPEMLASLKQVEPLLADPASRVADQQPRYAQNDVRSIKPDLLVLVGICTHLGCSPDKRLAAGPASGLGDDWLGGFFCPCHGSKFDLAGRVYQNVPAPTNLIVPPHSFLSDNRILIGVDQKGAA